MQTKHELLSNVYEAFNRRDIETVLSVIRPDVDWPNGWEGGRLTGHEALREYWTRQWAAINPNVDPVGFETDEAGRTVVNVHQIVCDLEGNIIVDGMVEHIYEFEGGQIKRMEIKSP